MHAQLDDHAAKSAAEKLSKSRMPGWCVRDPGTCRSGVIPGGRGVDLGDRISLGRGRGRAKSCKIRHPKKAEPRSHAEAEAGPGLTVEEYMAQPTSVKIFGLEGGVLDALETSLSQQRLATYVNAAGGDREQAVRLYTWNTAVSAAFYGPLQGLEVALRNAMHGQLTGVYGPAWFDNPACGLDAGALDRIDQAKRTLVKNGYPADPPHVVAELSFGFWVSLLGKGGFGRASNRCKSNYDMTLWRKALYKSFPHSRLSRADTHRPLDYLRTLRNRIAHHEPIFTRHLDADYRSLVNVTGWICPTTAAWIVHHSRVPELLRYPQDSGEVRF